jgi:hypothetical protein
MAKKVPVTSVTPASKVKATSKAQQSRTRALVIGIATATPIGRAAATAVKTAKAAKAASIAQKKNYEQKITIPARRVVEAAKREKETGVRVIPRKTASGPGLETRGNKITTASQKAAAKRLIKDDQLRTMNSPSMNYIDSTFRGPSLKTLKRNAPVKRAADKKLPIQINSAKPTKGSSDDFVEAPIKDTKYGERPRVFIPRAVAARKPTRKPTPNPANPPRGTVRINSGSKAPAVLRKRAVKISPKKK